LVCFAFEKITYFPLCVLGGTRAREKVFNFISNAVWAQKRRNCLTKPFHMFQVHKTQLIPKALYVSKLDSLKLNPPKK